MSKYYLGIDLGGTNVKAGLVSPGGELRAQISLPTAEGPDQRAAGPVIARILEAADQVLQKARLSPRQLAAVGIVAPGQASSQRGIVHQSVNFPTWRHVALRARVSAGLGRPAILENDANAAAYGEYWAGAGGTKGGKQGRRRLESLFMITLGTGVGGGFVEQGRVLRGSFDLGTEIGHCIVEPEGDLCSCGQRGCLEMYCSARQTGLRAMRLLGASRTVGRRSSLGRVLRETGAVSARDVAEHARKGDVFAGQVWDETCRYIALGCVNAARLFDPQMIVLAGGMSKSGQQLLNPVRRHLRSLWWKLTPVNVKVVLARLGNDAGVIGAAGLAKAAQDRGELPPIGR